MRQFHIYLGSIKQNLESHSSGTTTTGTNPFAADALLPALDKVSSFTEAPTKEECRGGSWCIVEYDTASHEHRNYSCSPVCVVDPGV